MLKVFIKLFSTLIKNLWSRQKFVTRTFFSSYCKARFYMFIQMQPKMNFLDTKRMFEMVFTGIHCTFNVSPNAWANLTKLFGGSCKTRWLFHIVIACILDRSKHFNFRFCSVDSKSLSLRLQVQRLTHWVAKSLQEI